MKSIFTTFSLLISINCLYSQTMQATIKAGKTPKTIDVYLKSSTSFSQKDETMTLSLAIPVTVLPAPNVGPSGTTANSTGPVSGITGLIPSFLVNNLNATQREVYISKEKINGDDYYVYAFIFATTAPSNHDWIAGEEQLIFSIQFNGCTSNCDPINELLVNLPNGGNERRAYWYFQANTLGDITNYAAPFYANDESGTPVNGGSNDGSALSTIALAKAVSLPIKLKSFNAKANGCSVNTNWEIATEVNASYYVIERSENGVDFNEVSRVTATVQNNLSKYYSFSDSKAPAGVLFYRLKMVTKDGAYSYSPIDEVNLSCSGKGNVQVYPTLTKGPIKVILTKGYENAKIRIVNSIGQEVAADAGGNLFRNINLKGLASGIYMVQVIYKSMMTDNVKIVLTQ